MPATATSQDVPPETTSMPTYTPWPSSACTADIDKGQALGLSGKVHTGTAGAASSAEEIAEEMADMIDTFLTVERDPVPRSVDVRHIATHKASASKVGVSRHLHKRDKSYFV